MYDPKKITQLIKQKAYELGFQSCGISKAEELTEEARNLEKWLSKNHNGQMQWMENHFDKRIDPRKLVEGAKSVISFTFNYFPEEEINSTLKISKYAYGKDYHKVLKKKLKQLFTVLKEEVGDINGRIFVDSAPVMEKAWAEKSGLGWVSKNTNLLTKQTGSFFFLAELISDLELEYDGPVTDHCGSCTRCLDACPTDALYEPYKIDASKCISYLTIELKDNIPGEFKNKMENWVFGCDICQDVCPWNRFSKPHREEDFLPTPEMQNLPDLGEITEEIFNEIFRHSPVKRTKFEGLKRNVGFLKK